MNDPRARDDANALMGRYAAGEDEVFATLYDYVAPRLHAYLLRQTRDPARAEDLVQQTFLQMHCARRHFAVGAEVIPWAFAIARRLMIDAMRKGRREVLTSPATDSERSPPAAVSSGPYDELASKQLAIQFERELARLPEAQREAFQLVKQDGLSMAEAAEVLGTTVNAVKLRAHRTYEALRSVMGDATDRGPGGSA